MMVADTFKHLRLRMVRDVVLVEIMSEDIQGPDRAKEFIGELLEVVGRESGGPLLVNLRRVRYLSSMGYSALFKMVKCAKEQRRPIAFYNMHEDVRVGAEAVNLPLVVTIHESEASALEALEQAEASRPV
jgi:anti-anti-sigma regulatory factor